MKASELLLRLEYDQEKALESFFKDWDEIVKTCEVDVTFGYIRARPNGKCLCPIIAVYFKRYGVIEPNTRAISLAVSSLGLSMVTAGYLVSAADYEDGMKPIKGYRQRLLKPHLVKLVKRFY